MVRWVKNIPKLAPAQFTGEFHHKVSWWDVFISKKGDRNGFANVARLTVTYVCTQIVYPEAKEISFPYISWLLWAKLRWMINELLKLGSPMQTLHWQRGNFCKYIREKTLTFSCRSCHIKIQQPVACFLEDICTFKQNLMFICHSITAESTTPPLYKKYEINVILDVV